MAGEDDGTGDWNEWRRHVLMEITRLNGNLERINAQHLAVLEDLSRLKMQSAMWGAIGGVIATAILARVLMEL